MSEEVRVKKASQESLVIGRDLAATLTKQAVEISGSPAALDEELAVLQIAATSLLATFILNAAIQSPGHLNQIYDHVFTLIVQEHEFLKREKAEGRIEKVVLTDLKTAAAMKRTDLH